MTDFDVVVVGAGPAGALAAAGLARAGRRVMLVDRARFPRDKVCGGCLQPSALRALEAGGLGGIAERKGAVPVKEMLLHAGTAKARDAGVFLIEYKDGFKAAVAMMNGYVYEGDGGAFTFAGQLKGKEKPEATHFYLQQPDPFAHFAEQLKAIESTIQTGHAVYPAERTLLTTGILDAVMISRHEKNRRVPTPYLDIRYQPTDWPFATDPVPKPIKR